MPILYQKVERLNEMPAPARQSGRGVQWVCEDSRSNPLLSLISRRRSQPSEGTKKPSGLLVLLWEGLWRFKETAGVVEMLKVQKRGMETGPPLVSHPQQ